MLHMQLYLWPPSEPALLSGGNRLSSLQPLDACERANIQACVLAFIARGLQVFRADNALIPLRRLFLNRVFFSFAHRTRQRPTIKATSTPGNSKPWRPRRTGSDELARPHPPGGSETESGSGSGIEASHPLLMQLFQHLWIRALRREQVGVERERNGKRGTLKCAICN